MSSESGALYAGSTARSPGEEIAGALTHGIGVVLSIVAGGVLMSAAVAGGDASCIAGCAFYASSLVAVYAASTLSHLQLPIRLNRMFRSLDQGCIYLLIVGSFTPFAVRYLTTPGWICFYVFVLTIAFGGFLSKTVFGHRLDQVSVCLYVALGWSEGIALKPMLHLIPTAGLCWIVAGGLCYTIGAVFLALDERRQHFHTIWHLLVIAGSACHYVAILKFATVAG